MTEGRGRRSDKPRYGATFRVEYRACYFCRKPLSGKVKSLGFLAFHAKCLEEDRARRARA